MTVPNNVLRFEALLYVSLLLDALSAAFFGVAPDDTAGASSSFVNMFSIVFIASLVLLVWLAARHRKGWACWTLLGFFTLSVVFTLQSFADLPFGLRTIVDLLSLAASAAGFYFAFMPDARQWFRSSQSINQD